MFNKISLKIHVFTVLACLIVPAFAQAQTAANVDPYAASDAKGNYLKPPLVYPANNASKTAPVVAVAPPQAVPPTVVSQQPSDETHGPFTYQNAPSAFSPITDRILADPTFLTSKGQILGNTAYSYSNFESVQKNNLDQKNFSEVARGNHVIQNLAYGLTDNLSLRATINYTASSYKDKFTNGSSRRVDNSGFTNPTFGATYRMVDQNRAPFIWDLNGSYTPDALPYKEGTTANAGTIAEGRQSGELSTSLSREMKRLTLQATAAVDFLGDQKALHLSDGSATDVKSSTDYFVGLRSQTRLTSRASVDLGGSYTFRDTLKAEDAADGYRYRMKQGNVADLYTALNYHLIPNRFVASGEYDHYLYGTDKYQYSQPTPLDNISWKNSGENLFLVRLHYLFF